MFKYILNVKCLTEGKFTCCAVKHPPTIEVNVYAEIVGPGDQ